MKTKPNFWLSICFPAGITWECADGAIRTRKTATRKIIMGVRKCDHGAETWLRAARNLHSFHVTLDGMSRELARTELEAQARTRANMPAWAKEAA
jgi:hypothetical protein